MNESDLRVIKTRASIERAFFTLLSRKPLNKITVSDLAAEARINKGTFYLHYRDLSDLHEKTINRYMEATFKDADYFNDFFDDPKKFCEELSASFTTNLPRMEILGQRAGTSLMQNQTLDMLREKIYATGRIRRCALNDMKLDALFGAILLIRPRYEAEHNREVDALMLSMIAHFKAD